MSSFRDDRSKRRVRADVVVKVQFKNSLRLGSLGHYGKDQPNRPRDRRPKEQKALASWSRSAVELRKRNVALNAGSGSFCDMKRVHSRACAEVNEIFRHT